MNYLTLNNGVKIPQLGLGVYLVQDPYILDGAIKSALKIGYRHFDTAEMYHNERYLGTSLKQARIPRKKLFLTSKIKNPVTTYDETQKALEQTLKDLQTDYLDLCLIHWPTSGYLEKWKALEKAYQNGEVKAIGVSNFEKPHLDRLLASAQIKPAVDQLETHPYFQQQSLHKLLSKLQIAHEAWGPLGQGKAGELNDPAIKEIANLYEKTSAQIILRWHLQRREIVIPKSVHKSRLFENFHVFDFNLSDTEMNIIQNRDKNQRLSPTHSPQNSDFMKGLAMTYG